MHESLRLRAVQSPIIPIIADLIRSCPGTVSLGQGVVGYGPPSAAIAQIERFLAEPALHKYQPVAGIPALLARIEAKLSTENCIRIGATKVNAPDDGSIKTRFDSVPRGFQF